MAKSMLELHPEEFAELDAAWKKLGKGLFARPSIENVRAVLSAEATVYQVSNGRPDPEIAAFIALDAPAKIDAATAWFQKQKAVISIATENAKKTPQAQQSDPGQQRRFQARVKAIDNALRILSAA